MLTQSSDASAISIITAIFATAVMEKRFRDIGFSRWWAVMGLASLIPPIAILAAWAHILCLITPALSRKSIQKKEPPKNNSSHRIQPLQQEKCRTRILQQPSRIKRKTWIIGSLAVIVISIALIVFLSNRHLINRELGPLILATELNPNDPYAWTSLAGGAYRASRHSMAEDAAKKAITLGQRGQSGGYLWLGRIYRDQNKNEEAIYCYQRATGVHARTDLGDFYHQLGDYEKSIEQYLKAIDLLLKETKKEDVGWWDWNSLGDVYLKLGKKKEAHDAFATALTLGVDLDSIKEKMAITSY